MIIDMHTHTWYSDGLFSPKNLIDQAIKKNLSGIAITDHDTLDSLEVAVIYASSKNDFVLIPGIEFGCEYKNKEVHLLGYFIDYYNSDLLAATKKLKKSRIERAGKVVEELNKLGLELDIDEVRKHSKEEDYIGRPHIARALVEKNYVNDIKEAFDKYLKKGAPAYVERFQLSISESIDLIKRAKGISVLAHPALIDDLEIIEFVISLGIDGIECYHSKHSKSDTKELIQISNDNNLLITGGSDYHGDEDILGNYYTKFNENPTLLRRVKNGQ